jgi:hypothetical protein
MMSEVGCFKKMDWLEREDDIGTHTHESSTDRLCYTPVERRCTRLCRYACTENASLCRTQKESPPAVWCLYRIYTFRTSPSLHASPLMPPTGSRIHPLSVPTFLLKALSRSLP